MPRKNYHQSFVIPLALVTSAATVYASWNLHTLKVDSPIVPTKAAARAWATNEAATQRCLPVSIDIEYSSQGFAPVTGDAGPWFATVRCNQTPQIYWRLALMLIIPWAALTALARLWFGASD